MTRFATVAATLLLATANVRYGVENKEGVALPSAVQAV